MMNIKITEINGWSKVFDVKKAITRIGSASFVDIQLPSNSVAPLHLQILSGPDLPTGCRIVNLANLLEIRNSGIGHPLPPNSTNDLQNGDEIQLGEYQITFLLQQSAAQLRTSDYIEAVIKFNDTILQPDLALDGILVIKNLGNMDACQFQVLLSGFPEDCFRIDPIPLLYPGATEEVFVRLVHHLTYPIAGHHDLLLTISAPEHYPGEEVVIRQGVYVAPVFKQSLKIMDDLAAQSSPERKVESDLLTSSKIERERGIFQPVSNEQHLSSSLRADTYSTDNVKKPAKVEKPIVISSMQQVEEKQIDNQPDKAGGEETPVVFRVPPQLEMADAGLSKTVQLKSMEPQSEILAEGVSPEKTEIPVLQKPDISKVKVAGKQPEQFWDEN
jgi:hypothetical protein